MRLVLFPVLIAWLPVVAMAEGTAAPTGIAAMVNGHVIPRSEVSFLLAPKFEALTQRFPERGGEFEKQLLKAREDVMQELMDRRLLIEESRRLGIQIAPERVEGEVQREIADAYQGDAKRLDEALKASRMTMEGYRAMLRDRLLEGEIRKRLAEGK